MRSRFFYCHGTSWLIKLMNPFTGTPLVQATQPPEIIWSFGDQVQDGGVWSTIAGVNGQTFRWNLNPTMDPFVGMLDPELWEDPLMVNYPASLIGGSLSIDYGVGRVVNLIKDLPKGQKFALGGFSQGAAVMSGVYMSGLHPNSTGPLEFKRADFLGATLFGNPRRQINHRGAGGQFGTFSGSWYDPDVDVGTGGCFAYGAYGPLTNCEDKWVEFVPPGEMICGNGTSPIENKWRALSGLMLGSFDIADFIQQALSDIFNEANMVNVFLEMIMGDGFGRVLPNYFIDAAGEPRSVGGSGHMHYPIFPPPDASGNIATTTQVIDGITYHKPIGDTHYQCALKWLNALARDAQAAPVIVPPTTSAGWSTTLTAPAA